MKTTHIAFGILCGLGGLLAGCGGDYYRVNDTAGQKMYYTTKIDQTKTGAITFKDEKGGSKVTLQSSEVKTISREEFEAGLKAPVAAPVKATPASAAAATAPVEAPAPAAAAPVEAPAEPAAAAPAEAPAQPAEAK
jgi:hypothetical protein